MKSSKGSQNPEFSTTPSSEIELGSNINMGESPLVGLEESAGMTGLPTEINPNKPFMKMHIMSSYGEVATVRIDKVDTESDIIGFYSKVFPKEAKDFENYIKVENEQLAKNSGMSKGGTIMRIGSIPEFIRVAFQFKYGLDFWEKPNAMTKFVRRWKGFMVGDHTRKSTKGVVIK